MQDPYFRSLPRVSVSFFVCVTCAKLTLANYKTKRIDRFFCWAAVSYISPLVQLRTIPARGNNDASKLAAVPHSVQ